MSTSGICGSGEVAGGCLAVGEALLSLQRPRASAGGDERRSRIPSRCVRLPKSSAVQSVRCAASRASMYLREKAGQFAAKSIGLAERNDIYNLLDRCFRV